MSTNLRTLPEPIPEFSRHAVITATRDAGGYAVFLDCGHTVWSAIYSGERMCCGACAWKFIEKMRRERGQR